MPVLERGPASRERRARRVAAEGRPATGLTFAGVAAVVVASALPGGSYDIVIRQAAGMVVWVVLAVGFATGLLPRSRPRPQAWLPVIALGMLGGWTMLSLTWTQSDERTLAEASRVVCYLGLLLLVLSTLDRRTWRAAAGGLATGALVVAALSTASRLTPGLFPSDPVLAFSNARLNYPFDYWNAVGAWGAMAATAALAWSVSATRPAVRAAALGAIPVAALSMYLSFSRAAIAGTAAGVLCVLVLSPRRLLAAVHLAAAGAAAAAAVVAVRRHPSLERGAGDAGALDVLLVLTVGAAGCAVAAWAAWRAGGDRWLVGRRTTRIAAGVAAACLLIAAAIAGPALASRAWDSFRQDDPTATLPQDPAERFANLHGSRYAVWSEALDAFRASPDRGSGAGTFEFAWNRAGRSPEFVRDAHSIYLEPLAEIGWPGAGLMVAFLVCLAVAPLAALRRSRRAATKGAAAGLVAAVVVFLVQGGVDWLWETTAVTALAIAAAAIASMRLSDETDGPVLDARGRIGAAAGSMAMCLVLLPGLVSVALVRDSRASVAAGYLERASQQANDATAAAPWSATAWLQRGLVAEKAGDLAGARAGLREAARLEPANWRPPFLLARIERALGRPRAASRALERARRLRPKAVVFQPAARE